MAFKLDANLFASSLIQQAVARRPQLKETLNRLQEAASGPNAGENVAKLTIAAASSGDTELYAVVNAAVTLMLELSADVPPSKDSWQALASRGFSYETTPVAPPTPVELDALREQLDRFVNLNTGPEGGRAVRYTFSSNGKTVPDVGLVGAAGAADLDVHQTVFERRPAFNPATRSYDPTTRGSYFSESTVKGRDSNERLQALRSFLTNAIERLEKSELKLEYRAWES